MRRRGAHYSPQRKHDTPSLNLERRDNHNGYRRHPAKHQERTSNNALRTSNKHSVNSIKSKIRDLTRSLNHNQDLPAGVRIEKERALAGYKQDLEKAEQEKQKQALITRYHLWWVNSSYSHGFQEIVVINTRHRKNAKKLLGTSRRPRSASRPPSRELRNTQQPTTTSM